MSQNQAESNPEPLSKLAQSGAVAGKEVPTGMMAGDQVRPGEHPEMNPGDALPPDAPGAGESICYHCNGSGKMEGGETCQMCNGSGRIIESVSGGP